MNKKLNEIFQKATQTIVRYPIVLLMALLMALTAVHLIENKMEYNHEYFLTRILFCASLGISLFFGLKMLSQRIGRELLLTIAGLLFLVGYYFILPKKREDFNDFYAFIIAPTYLLTHLLVAFAPYLRKENTEKSFWEYNKNLFVNFALTLIFTGVLTAGVELAIVAVDQLFTFKFDSLIYPKTFFMMAIFGSTFIFLLFNEAGLDFLEKESEYPIVLKFFTQFILIPLLFIYVVILYFYSGKILLAWELPRGWVSYLVLAYSVVGILALLLVHPLKEVAARSWVKAFSKIFYFSLIPLVVLLFTAIFTRLLQYGFTEPRYFVLLLAIWVSTIALYFIFRKEATIKFIPVSLFLFGLFALIFPYFNALSVSKRSQKKELENILMANNLLEKGKINFSKPVIDTVARQITNKFEYLNERFEKEYLAKFLMDSIKAKKEFINGNFWDYAAFFPNIKSTTSTKNATFLNLISKKTFSTVENYQYIIQLNSYENPEVKIKNDIFKINKTASRKDFITITLNSKQSIDLTPQVKAIFKKYNFNAYSIETDDLFIENSIGNYQFRLNFSNLNKSDYSGEIEYSFENAILLLKEK
ncbi:DUF4153 domain-containing protein [Flavobacterium amniphilum]|uniref:DUF4153 domain-containing protein n=1 Tax=Flavobacterium amniphilum TaxID=1834035 RepID=UPI00202A03BB|nr:DUF4153 domain-containing protein [Flavobacterium amniphilum]MCL9804921.1 DUF4153 domain-containing protein [Flavobacterium amniphilum]